MTQEKNSKDAAPEPTLVIEDDTLAQGFTMLPNRILRARNVSCEAKMLYTLLLSYAWQSGQCFPGYELLAEDMGKSLRSVQSYMNELEQVGLVRVKRRGLGLTNVYTLVDLRTANFAEQDRQNLPMRPATVAEQERQPLPANNTQRTKTQKRNMRGSTPLSVNQRSYEDAAFTTGRYSGRVQHD